MNATGQFAMRKSPYQVDYAYLKRVVPLTLILSHYGLDGTFKRVGTRLKGACPIHKGSNKRQFVIDPDASTWRCFGDCDRGGALLEFVAAMEGVGIDEAARLVVRWFAITPLVPAPATQGRRKTVSGKPSHKAFVVEDRDEENSNESTGWWTRVGSVWPHGDGKGYNIVLSALPINGRLVLREYTEEDAKVDEEKQKKVTKRK